MIFIRLTMNTALERNSSNKASPAAPSVSATVSGAYTVVDLPISEKAPTRVFAMSSCSSAVL